MKVRQFKNKNQFIIESENEIVFQSYDSIIAKIDKTKTASDLTLGKNWDYSITTLKHLYLFFQDYYYITIYSKIEGSNNKKAEIQKMIDDGFIKYDKELI